MTSETQKIFSRATAEAPRVLAWLEEQESAMIDMLRTLVNIDSGSYDKPGVDAVGAEITRFLDGYGIGHRTQASDTVGDVIRAEVGPGDGRSPVLLMGHRDTVFPKGEAARRPFRIENGIAYGPGVADMKSGLVINSFVMAALAKFNAATRPVVALYTGDEEIASPFSRPLIEAEARGAHAVFNAEPGRANGNVVTGRRGCVFAKLDIVGRAAHSGVNYADGRSAIEELSQKIIALHKLTDIDAGITLNVGLASGGTAINTVAPHAKAEFDLRYVDPGLRDGLLERVARIVDTQYVPDTSATFEVTGEFLPLFKTPDSERLLEHYVAGASECGFHVDGEFTGGCADSGFAASMGVPVLCATGPVGARVHSPDEYTEVATIVPRAKALALAILTLDD